MIKADTQKGENLRLGGGKIMARLIVLLGSLSYVMILAVINGSVGFLCSIGVTVFGALAIAKLLGESIALSYTLLIVLAVVSGIIRGLLRYLEQYGNHYIAFKLLAVLRDKIFTALRRLCPAKLETKKKGSIISTITSDIETLEVFYAHTVSPIFIAVIVSLFMFVFTGILANWYLAAVGAAGYIFIGTVLPAITSSRVKTPGVMYRKSFSRFNAYFLDSIKGIKEIVINNAQFERIKEVDRRSDELLGETKKLKKAVTEAESVTELTVTLFILLTLCVGILLYFFDSLSIGKLIIGLAAIMSSFGPVIAISALPGNLTQTFASGDRVLNLIDEKPAVEPVMGASFDFNKAELKDVSFSYEKNIKVLDDINMYINCGEIVAIKGDSGSGKSTILKLMLRFWEKDSGAIYYNGTDIDKTDSISLTDNVTMVSQSTYLFDYTIENNLRIAKPDAGIDEIRAACKKAAIDDFIMTLPDKYETRTGQLGDNLSSGERQRLGLARALLAGGKLILLDEPTSNVDSINEGIILNALKNLKKEKGILLVSHRESTMAIADRIYKLKNGRLEEL